MKNKKLKRWWAGAVLSFLTLSILTACGDNTAAPATNAATKQAVKLTLSYVPNVQFAPFYVALDKGYFAAEGLDVSFDYSTVNDVLALVGQGKIQFAAAGGDEVLQARAAGVPVTYITTVYQKYPIALAALKDKNIKSVTDLKGKSIGIPGPYGSNYIGLKVLLNAAKLTEQDVTEQSIGFTQREALAAGKVDAAMVFSMNEPVQLEKAGVAVDKIEVSSIYNLASVGLATSESVIAQNPELVQKIVRAMQHGLKDTIANPDAAFDSTIKVAPDAKGDNPDLQRAVLKETVKYLSNDSVKGQPIGYSDPKLWENTAQFLFDNKLTRVKVEAGPSFTNKYLSTDIKYE